MASSPESGRAAQRVIGIVASAGGIEAISTVLAQLPTAFGAAVLVVLHQDPERDNRLAQVLGRQSALPVATARNDERLEAGTVRLCPPGRQMLVTREGRTVLIPSGALPPSRPSGDLMLATLATAYGDQAVAVVLSGYGHDAATGACAIQALDGTVIATDEATSAHFSMPRAAVEYDGTVDHVVGLPEVAPLLTRLVGDSGG